MVWKARRQDLVSQRLEVALVYQQMLGLDEAARYLEREGVAPEIAQRVLLTEHKRPSPMAAADQPAQLPYVGCRRKNLVHDAIVEAALKIEKKLGMEMALTLLREEQVADTVVARLTAPEPRELRARKQSA